MNDYDEVWAYDKPHESGGNFHVTMTKHQAIAWARKTWASVYSKYPYTDEEVFNEFVVVHRAYKEKEKDNAKVE